MGKAAKSIGFGVLAIGLSFIPGVGPVLSGILRTLGTSFVLGGLAQAMAPKPKRPRPQYNIQYDGTMEPRAIIYGQIKTSGMNVIPPWTSGDGNKHLHRVIALCGHEVEDITDVYFNQDVIASANIGAVTGTLSDGVVSAGTYANKAWIRRYKGTSGQTADFILDTAFSAWTSNHRGRGVAYVATKFEVDDAVYKTGEPQQSFIVKGKKCYDPRLDSSPGANPTNASYIAYTRNPALCLADYLTDTTVGCKIPTAKIDWDLVVAAANECDEDVTIPPASPTTTQDRYTCNVRIFVATNAAERRENITLLAGAMMGYVNFQGGKYRMYAGAAQSSGYTLTDDDLVGRVTVTTELGAEKKYNYVPGQFVDSARNYQLLPFEPRSNSTYESDDGGRKEREVEFPACTSQYEAQRNAIVILKRSRRKLEISGLFGFSAYKVRPGKVGTLTLSEWGITNQLVRCQSWKMLPNFTFEISFTDELSSDWNDPAVGDYTVPSSAAGPGAGDFVTAPVQNFTAIRVQDGILFQWEPPENAPVGTRYKIYEHTSATPFSSAVVVANNLTGTSRTVIKADTTTRYYWITAMARVGGTESAEAPTGDGIPGSALAITTGFRATVSSGNVLKILVGVSSGNSSSVTVTPINGVAPYTHSWARISGDTTITANSTTSATTSFNNTGMVDEEHNTSVFRDTVTDSTGGTPLTTTVDVTVNFIRDDSFGS